MLVTIEFINFDGISRPEESTWKHQIKLAYELNCCSALIDDIRIVDPLLLFHESRMVPHIYIYE